MLLGKKAVSPLIATVLLVMIVVSIGAAIMVVIQGITQEQLQSTEAQQQLIKCGTDVNVGLLTVNEAYRICIFKPDNLTGGNLKLYMENKGIRDIADWRFRVIGDNNISDTDGGYAPLSKGSVRGFSFDFSQSVGMYVTNVQKITIAPKIPGGPSNPTVTCSEPNLECDYTAIQEFSECGNVTWDDVIS